MAARGPLTNNMTASVGSLALAAGTDDNTNCTAVDLADYDGCVFVALFGAITANAVTSIHAEESSDNTTFTDIAGTNTSIADTGDNTMLVLDVFRPKERYARCVLTRATDNAVLHSIVNFPYNVGVAPVSHHADVANNEIHVSPDAGTL